MTVWLVRAGKNGERQDLALKEGLAVIGWEELPDLSKVSSKEDLEKLHRATYPDAKTNTMRNHIGQIWAFASRMQLGDLVVLPLKGRATIAIGRVRGPYKYQDLPQGVHHTRPVEWIKEIPRSAFDQDILYSLGAFMTVCQIERNQAEDRIRALLGGKQPTKTSAPSVVASVEEPQEAQPTFEPEQIAREQLMQHINRKFKGHDLTRLVEAVLQAQGYQTVRSRAGPDESIDILAGKGHMGFDEPRLGVEVKSQDSPVGTDVVDKLRGGLTTFGATQGLLVSWGGFKQSVDPRKQFFGIRLWDADDLVDALLENYDRLPKDLQAEIPLKRIWTLVPEE